MEPIYFTRVKAGAGLEPGAYHMVPAARHGRDHTVVLFTAAHPVPTVRGGAWPLMPSRGQNRVGLDHERAKALADRGWTHGWAIRRVYTPGLDVLIAGPEPEQVEEPPVSEPPVSELRLHGQRLRLVEIYEDWSIYEDVRSGDEVCLQHGTGRRLVPLDELLDVWRREEPAVSSVEESMKWAASWTYEPENLCYLAPCSKCYSPENEDDTYTTRDGSVCDTCQEEWYFSCDWCEVYARDTERTWTLGEDAICDVCRTWSAHYCDYCEGYYGSESDEHDHDNGCECEAPAQRFRIRNDGQDPLPNDTRVAIPFASGTISEAGLWNIRQVVAKQWRSLAADHPDKQGWLTLHNKLDELGDEWQTKRGNYTRRLSRLAYAECGIKVPPEVLSEIGNIGAAHSVNSPAFHIEVTRDLNLSAYAFGNEESCWWGSESDGRCAFKSNGGFGLRSFDTYDYVSGRAWVMPLRWTGDRYVATFETENPDAFVVFNGYGDLDGYTPARIVAHMAGLTYRRIEFDGTYMWVNNNSGFLVAPEDRMVDSIVLDLDKHSDLYQIEAERDNDMSRETISA